ncbi:MAG: CCA tRNA nucleotidyltransferase [Candidatus ainarchaeum sp.]|nr:CCA tRNA nucleotidyltransferase [Candidatus ainarchaeum sp.]
MAPESMEKTLQNVLKKVTPGEKEREEVEGIAREAEVRIGELLPSGVKTMLTGSVKKGTFLAEEGDVDLFALFPHSYSKELMFEEVRGAVESAYPKAKMEIAYAEHPYVKFHLNGKKIDVVPAYLMVEGERIKSAVDRSQLHTRYVLEKMEEGQKGEVLLLKKFLKANGLYGAEIKTLGFSGYLCELLIIAYGDFEGVLKAASKWGNGKVALDLEAYYANEKELWARFPEQFIVVDPVDSERNVAAPVSAANFSRFINACRKFLTKPSEEFFFPKKMNAAGIGKWARGRNLYGIEFANEKIVDDVLWGQIRRVGAAFGDFLSANGFTMVGSHPYSDGKRTILLFEVKEKELPKEKEMRGPLSQMKEDCVKFRSKHKKAKFVEREGRLFAIEKRRWRDFSGAFREYAKKGFVPSHLGGIRKGKVLSGKGLIRYKEGLEEYIRYR